MQVNPMRLLVVPAWLQPRAQYSGQLARRETLPLAIRLSTPCRNHTSLRQVPSSIPITSMQEAPRGIGLPPRILILPARVDSERAGSNLDVLTISTPVVKYSGRYFHEAVLIDGALRLVPHFIAIKEDVCKRILLRDTDDCASISKPQKRRIESVKPLETNPADTCLGNKRVPPVQKLDKPEANGGQTKSRSSGHIGFYHGTFRRQATFRLPSDATCSSFVNDFDTFQRAA
ncbi:hypothetical protein BKA63DRAFT_61960 [Paraphoma chrysanthemicola]|nr:hypothetical protein BKA63DRAFT_61960 [Paraphoma chrysanthemicola]